MLMAGRPWEGRSWYFRLKAAAVYIKHACTRLKLPLHLRCSLRCCPADNFVPSCRATCRAGCSAFLDDFFSAWSAPCVESVCVYFF